MLKATMRDDKGHIRLFIGLSFGNLDRLHAEPMDTYINIDGDEVGIPIDITIFSGTTEQEMQEFMLKSMHPTTVVTVSDKPPT